MQIRPVPKYVTFDVFSALFDWEGSLVPLVRGLQAKNTQIDVSSFLQLWRRTQLEYTYLSTMLGKGHVNFETLTHRALEYTLKTFRVATDEKLMKGFVDAWGELNPFPDVKEGLLKLKEKYAISMLSNGDGKQLARLGRKLGVTFETIISADLAGVYKPHPKIYMEAVKRMGNDPSRIFHVAGSSRDAIGAKIVGMKTGWINRKGLPMDWNYPLDLEVKSFSEVSSALLG